MTRPRDQSSAKRPTRSRPSKSTATVQIELYSARRKAEFLLKNAVGPLDYNRATQKVRLMGLDPESIPHRRP